MCKQVQSIQPQLLLGIVCCSCNRHYNVQYLPPALVAIFPFLPIFCTREKLSQEVKGMWPVSLENKSEIWSVEGSGRKLADAANVLAWPQTSLRDWYRSVCLGVVLLFRGSIWLLLYHHHLCSIIIITSLNTVCV